MSIAAPILAELELFTYAFTFGVFLTFLYDGLLILRKVFRHTTTACMAEDVLYWLLVIPCTLVVIFRTSKGVLQWYFLVGVSLGILIYKCSVSKGYIRIMSKIAQHIVVYINKTIDIVSTPLKRLEKAIKMAFFAVKNFIKKFTIIPKMWLTVCIKWFKITLCKHNGGASDVDTSESLGEIRNGR